MKPIEVLNELISREFLMPGKDKNLGVGQVVLKKLSPEKLKIIQELKSETLQNLRLDSIFEQR
ncbi:MAG: hypothetical protein WCG45_03525 [bacterium]